MTIQIFSFSFRNPPLIDAILFTGIPSRQIRERSLGGDEMTRSPRVDSACRFFPDITINLHRPAQAALAIGFGLAISCTSALAQTPAKGSPDHIKAVTSAVDGASIKANTATSNDWPTIGLDYAETRFSKLNQINTDNVKKLGLVWSYPLESSRGVEATPVVVDGIMYQTASWSVVHAIDARTGKTDLELRSRRRREKGYKGCCDVVNRGVALWKGKVFVGAYDGRLIALDAVTGAKVLGKGHPDRQGALLHHHRRAARVQRQGRDRQWRRRIRRARLRHRL